MMKQWFVAFLVAPVWVFAIEVPFARAEKSAPKASPSALAQKLFDEAIAAMDAHKYAEACRKLEQVTELVPKGVGAHEMLGECYEKMGRLGSAWEQYTLAQTLAADQIRIDGISAKAKQLEARVARLTIVVPSQLRSVIGLSVLHDGRIEEKALWDTPLPVDKGKHVIEVKAPGFQTWTKEVDISVDGNPQTILLPTQLVSIPAPPLPPVRPEGTWLRPMGWTLTSMGVASGATSGILTWLALRQQSASVSSGHCDANNRCDAEGVAMRERALGMMHGATATAIAGGVLAAGGITMLIVAPKKRDDTPRKTAGPWWSVDVAPQGVRLYGTW
jgi:hypothetical protein